ncbi:hypothetical protein BDY24DRAFT_234096 [Mrakia frigida]|uniref:uncharacterized protein n=1 Tax=Mrakia frigida TaxID=29902 RepID=UPI003FCBF9BB
MPSPHLQPLNMNFPLYGYEPPSPFHAPPSPFYPPPSPFHAPFQYHHQQQQQQPTDSSSSSLKEGEGSVPGEGKTPPARGGGGAHPGPISLPPAYFGGAAVAAGGGGGGSGPGSPMLGRNGMPMMTPSMPAFQFGGPFQIPVSVSTRRDVASSFFFLFSSLLVLL